MLKDTQPGKSSQKNTSREVFVGGCHPKVTKGIPQTFPNPYLDEITTYFNQFGKVELVRLKVSQDKSKPILTILELFRGFCYVKFENYETVDVVLKKKRHFLREKKIDVKLAISKKQNKNKLQNERNRKLFIVGLQSPLIHGNPKK